MKGLFILMIASSFHLEFNFKSSAGQIIPSTSSKSSPAILGLTLLKEPEDALLTARGAYLNHSTQIVLPPNTISSSLPSFSSLFSLSILFLPNSPGCLLNLKFSIKTSAKLCWTKNDFGLITNKEVFLPLFKVPSNFYESWNALSFSISSDSSKRTILSEIKIKSYENEIKFYNSYEEFQEVLPEFLVFSKFSGVVSNFFVSTLYSDHFFEFDKYFGFTDSTENFCPDSCFDFCIKDEKFICVTTDLICGAKFLDIEEGLCFDKILNCVKQKSKYCVDCEFGYSLSESKLSCTLHNVHQKLECYVECATCSGPTFLDCLTCADPNANPNPSGQCKCNKDFHQYNNNPLACTYKSCDQDCLYCTGPESTQCIECSDSNAYLDQNNNCVCSSGYYDAGSSLVDCSACHDDCKTCNGGLQTDCIDCKDTNSHIDSLSSLCSCNEGFYLMSSVTFACQSCNSNCKTCSGPDANQCTGCFSNTSLDLNGNCVSICNDGYVSADSQCKQCHKSCFSCSGTSDTECIYCKDSNAEVFVTSKKCECKAGYVKINNICTKCHNSCLSCTGITESDCISCNDSNAEVELITGKCECNTGYVKINNICTKCHDSCFNCTGISESDCIACSDFNAKVSTINSKCECMNGFIDLNNICTKCHDSCFNCTGITNVDCISCKDSNAEVSLMTSECECKIGYYLSNFSCHQCHKSCLSCSGGTENDCLVCIDSNSYVSDQGNCVCLQGYTKSNFDNITCLNLSGDLHTCGLGYFLLNFTCEKCNENCSECENFEFCTACNDQSMIFIDQKCVCPDEFISVSGTCECSLNHYKLNGTCTECLVGCDQCLSDLMCTEPTSGYYIDSGIPYPCDKSCFECTGPSFNNCLACATPKILNNSTCVCPDGQYLLNSKCIWCAENCKKCSSKIYCEVCKEPYLLDSSNKCFKSAPQEPYTKIFNSFASNLKYVSFAFAYFSASFTSQPSVVWTTINTVQILCYVPLQNIDLPNNLFTFFKSLQPISLIPNIWEILNVNQCNSNLISPFYKYGYTCEYFVTNTGEVFLAFIVSILYLFVILILFCVCFGQTKSFLLKLIKMYKWGYFIRFWMEAFLDIAIPCIISVNYVINNQLSLESKNQIVNSTLGFVFIVKDI